MSILVMALSILGLSGVFLFGWWLYLLGWTNGYRFRDKEK